MANIICRDGMKFREKSEKRYNMIWDSFKSKYAEDFKNFMGFGVEEIEKIGYKLFLDTMDWYRVSDIKKYRSNVVKVIPCLNCNSKFALYPLEFGLCSDCKNEFDIKEYSTVLQMLSQEGLLMATMLFYTNKEFRDSFKLGSDKKYLEVYQMNNLLDNSDN